MSKIKITIGDNSPVIVESSNTDYDKIRKKVTHYIAPRCYEGNDEEEIDPDVEDEDEESEADADDL